MPILTCQNINPPALGPVVVYLITNLKGIRTTVFTFSPPIEPGRKRIRGKTSRTASPKNGCVALITRNVAISARPRASTTNSTTVSPSTPRERRNSGYRGVGLPDKEAGGASTSQTKEASEGLPASATPAP